MKRVLLVYARQKAEIEEVKKPSEAMRARLHRAAPTQPASDSRGPQASAAGMVTRTGWNGETWGANQRISVDEALLVNTINGAYNSHEDVMRGSITPGKLADFVVLADDPHTVNQRKSKISRSCAPSRAAQRSTKSTRLECEYCVKAHSAVAARAYGDEASVSAALSDI
ncbi:MAG TPA: amidohydrolase family protein, partial [Candidatus Acidoferrum sp.]|nr:amidohydrolase family protein [Candidatus Acidoferrum sp.]